MKIIKFLEPLNEVESPDLWQEIERRELRPPQWRPTPPRRRIVATLAALFIGVTGVAVAIEAFRGAVVTYRPAQGVSAGLIAYAGGPSGGPQIFAMLQDGTNRVALTGVGPASPTQPYPAWEPAWSPSGDEIAFRGYWGDGEFSDLFVMNADGANLRQLTERLNGSDPAWSPDGTRIAFAGYDGIYAIRAGGSDLQRLTTGSGQFSSPSWSPDGASIAFAMSVDGSSQVFVMDATGENVRQLTHLQGGAAEPAWSPDGARIAFQGGVVTAPGIYLMNADGGAISPITNCQPPTCSGDSSPTWLPDGSRIGFVQNSDLFLVNPDGSDLIRITYDQAGYGHPVWQPIPTGMHSSAPT